MAKARANEIYNGSQAMVEKYTHEKSFFTALREISENVYSYDELEEKSTKAIKNSIFGIYADHSKSSVDKFDESSIFAKNFLNNDSGESSEKIELDDLLQGSFCKEDSVIDENSEIAMIGGFENMNDEDFKGFTDGAEIFENEESDEVYSEFKADDE